MAKKLPVGTRVVIRSTGERATLLRHEDGTVTVLPDKPTPPTYATALDKLNAAIDSLKRPTKPYGLVRMLQHEVRQLADSPRVDLLNAYICAA